MKYIIATLLFCLELGITPITSQTIDLTRTPGTSGPEVVEAVLDILRKSCIFPDDHSFLRRVAYVDSDDGTRGNTYRAGYYGGIWQIDQDVFEATKTAPNLQTYRDQLRTQLFIDWNLMTWQDLRKPLFSGIAAELALLNRLRGSDMPVTIEEQASLWSAGNQSLANIFFKSVQNLNAGSIIYNDVDVVFVLDSSASLSATDFDKVKNFTRKVIQGFDIDNGKVKVAVLKYSSVPNLIFGLDNNMNKNDILNAVGQMSYMPGSTATSDALQFVKDNVFPNGGRKGASQIVVLVTDGLSDDRVSTIQATNELKASGVKIFAVGVGHDVDLRELNAVASTPKCIYMKTVSNYTVLPAINYEIQQLSQQAIVNLPSGTYSFDCDSSINLRIASDNGRPRTIEVISQNGGINIFGSGSSYYSPSSAIYTFSDTANKQSVIQIYVRDGSEVFLTFRNATTGGCTSSFQVRVLVGDHIKSGSHVTCIENKLVSTCRPSDLLNSPFVITGTPEPQVQKLCPAVGISILPHPLESDRYLFCSSGNMTVVFCTGGERFNIETSRCEYAGPGSVTTSPKPAATPSPTAPAVTIKTPNSSTPLINPCTPDHIIGGLLFWLNPLDNTSFIHCDVYPFSGTIQQCPPHKYYEPSYRTCLYSQVVLDPLLESFSGLPNPCVKNFFGDVQYHPYPGNPHRFIQCDAFGDAFVKECQMNEVWEQSISNCIPSGFRYQTKPPVPVGK